MNKEGEKDIQKFDFIQDKSNLLCKVRSIFENFVSALFWLKKGKKYWTQILVVTKGYNASKIDTYI